MKIRECDGATLLARSTVGLHASLVSSTTNEQQGAEVDVPYEVAECLQTRLIPRIERFLRVDDDPILYLTSAEHEHGLDMGVL